MSAPAWCVLALLALASPARAQQTVVEYIHTDPLGSIVAITNAQGTVIEERGYEPYGLQQAPIPIEDGPGYAGHVQDLDTGLTYMEQRYYDPAIGRMLSVDPVTAYSSGDWRQFNLYSYGFNNPYRFTDPDGRQELSVWPVPGYYQLNEADKPREGRGEFGSPRNTSRGSSTHSGIDVKAPVGTPVVAAGDGEVVNIRPNPSTTYGNQVVIDHGGGTYTQSAHLDSASVEPGDAVEAGQQIGTVGTTGNTPATGDSHLHFEVRKGSPAPRAAGGTVVDPMKELPPPPPSRPETRIP